MSVDTDAAPPVAAGEALASLDIAETLSTWRAQGAHRAEPVRWRFIEAMARRAATQHGAARELLEAKLAREIAAYAQRVAAQPAASMLDAGEAPSAANALNALGDLRALVERLAQAAQPATVPGAEQRASMDSGSPAELKALRYFRRTWTKLSADQRLSQSLAKVPDNAGPLNSQHLVHRSLLLMRELSPEYLHRFMAHVDALLWLERALGR